MTSNHPIVKNILHAGKQFIPIAKGSKVHFHFQTWRLSPERALLDDSRTLGQRQPMVLVIGHKFKLEVWEQIVQMMAVGEVASFVVNHALVFSYPFVSKTLRDLGKEHKARHSCTMTLQTEGIGHKDLDELMAKPCDLEFIIELLKVERPDEYEKDLWQLNETERLTLVPELREKGNKLYCEGKTDEAEEVYAKAIGICEQLILREKKNDEEWYKLQDIKIPILLNYAQCKLKKGDYYSVIEHCNTVLEFHKDNEKALYRRARAHVGAWNPDQAEADFARLRHLCPAMTTTIDKELANINKLRRQREKEDKNNFKHMFASES